MNNLNNLNTNLFHCVLDYFDPFDAHKLSLVNKSFRDNIKSHIFDGVDITTSNHESFVNSSIIIKANNVYYDVGEDYDGDYGIHVLYKFIIKNSLTFFSYYCKDDFWCDLLIPNPNSMFGRNFKVIFNGCQCEDFEKLVKAYRSDGISVSGFIVNDYGSELDIENLFND
jgi:hypothetical protein